MQVAYGNEPASPQLCVALDRETNGIVAFDHVNDRWAEHNGAADGRKRIPMDWDYLTKKLRAPSA